MNEPTQLASEDKFWWKQSGYGYDGRIPCTLIRMSKTGHRAKIRIVHPQGYTFISYVKPSNLEPRHD